MPAAELFGRIRGHGFETVQFAFSDVTEARFVPSGQIEIPENIDDALIRLVAAEAKRCCLPIGAVNGTFNAAHPDPAIRAEGVRRFEVLAAATTKLGCPIITLCSGTRNPDYLWSPHAANGEASAWADMIEVMKALAAIAERHGIVLAIETEAANVVDTPEKARRAMEEVGSARLKMVMDCANLFHPGEAMRANVDAAIRHAFALFGGEVVVAHGKDIRESEGIDFCATGEGIVDYVLFARLLAESRFPGDMMLHGIFDEEKMPAALALMRRACA
jgi:sugar phosphate isomerase/epimerase